MWRIIPWLLLVAAVAVTASAHPSLRFANDRRVRGMFVDVLVRGGTGMLQTESAAFVVTDDSAGYRCIAWPAKREARKQVHTGAAPSSTVAIVHTHPKKLHRPSSEDLATARTAGIPVLVLTPMHIYAAMPDGTCVPLVYQQFWANQERSTCEERREGGVARKGPDP